MQYIKRKNRTSALNKTTSFILASCILFFINTWMWVSIKRNILNKIWENHLSVKDYGWIGSEWWSKHRWSRALPSTPLKLNSPKPLSGSTFHLETFWFTCCLMLDNCVILHMHLLTYAVACFLLFAMSWPRDSIVFQKMFNSGSYYKHWKHWIP